jgi:inhibitor of KinA sporulation pathway (predicted exonuclease)
MPKRRLDQVLVVDVESTCWEGPTPEGQESEIIEIGLCLLDVATATRLERRSILVKPERSSVSAFCTQLTTLTQDQVAQGIAFADACALLKREYASAERVWASYGEYDRQQFERQCRSFGVAYPFGPRHLNVKLLFALAAALPREVGMDGALHLLQFQLEGTHHRGGDDAWNIAGILAELLKRSRAAGSFAASDDAAASEGA